MSHLNYNRRCFFRYINNKSMRDQDDNKLGIGLSTYRNDHEARFYRKKLWQPWKPANEKHSSMNVEGMNMQTRKA